jgi:hypothetical protein
LCVEICSSLAKIRHEFFLDTTHGPRSPLLVIFPHHGKTWIGEEVPIEQRKAGQQTTPGAWHRLSGEGEKKGRLEFKDRQHADIFMSFTEDRKATGHFHRDVPRTYQRIQKPS